MSTSVQSGFLPIALVSPAELQKVPFAHANGAPHNEGGCF